MATTALPQTRSQQQSRKPLWRRRAFMLFWSGETVSLFGTQVTLLALPLTAVLTLQATVAQVGFIRFLGWLPYILFSLIFGAWVDQRRRKPILLLANAGRAVLIGLVPLLAVLNVLQFSQLAVIAFAVGVLTVLFDITLLAYVPTLVETNDLVRANGAVATSASAAQVAGPGLGGALVQVFSAPLALLVDMFSYVAATITLLLIRAPESAPRIQQGQRRRLLIEVREGLATAWAAPFIRSTMVISGLYNILFNIADTVFIVYAVRELHMEPGTVGAIFGIGAIGGLIGTTISIRLGRRGRFGPALSVAFILGCAPWVLLPAVSGPQTVEIVAFTLVYFLTRFGQGLWVVLVTSYRQAIVPNHTMGRVQASIRFISFGGVALGSLLSGVLASLIGLRPTLWVAAVGLIAIMLIMLFATSVPRVRSMPTSPAATEPK